jgi:hypothetical protein
MVDPRLQSVHLESMPRREKFRQMRSRVERAIGDRTLVGELVIGQSAKTPPNERSSVSTPIPPQATTHCWLLHDGRQLPLHVGLNSIGRLPDNDIILEDDCVSRRHCAIVVHSNLSVELYDIASKNGTKINSQKLKGPTKLTDGDEINICGCRMIFVLKSGSPTVNHSSIQLHLNDDMTLIG